MGKFYLPIENLVFARNSETTAVFTGTTRVRAQCEPMNPDRGLQFQCLNGKVHTIGGVRLDDINSVRSKSGTAAASDQFADNKTSPIGLLTAKLKDQHFARCICSHLLRQDIAKGRDH